MAQPIGNPIGARRKTRLEVGDRLPPFMWRDRSENRLSLGEDRFGGRATILFLCPPPLDQLAQDRIRHLANRQEIFQSLGIQAFIVVTGKVPEFESLDCGPEGSVPVVCEPSGNLAKAFGESREPQAQPDWRIVLLDECHRIEHLILWKDGTDPVDKALAHCISRRIDQRPGPRHPPVLVLPNLLSPDHCQRLIAAWESGNRFQGGVASAKSKHEVETKIKIREDVALPDLGAEAQELFAIWRYRVLPEVSRIFHYEITRAETLRLGCYQAGTGGAFKAHRDDSSPAVQHRAFAMSIFLNTGAYQGGALRFPEYSRDLYDPPAGSGVVFSCSLLHEVTPVTAGRRFGLFSFFHGEAEEEVRRANGAPYEYIRVDRPAPARRLTS